MPRQPKDTLAEINGVKPDVLLQDGEEKPVMSKTSGCVPSSLTTPLGLLPTGGGGTLVEFWTGAYLGLN